MPSERAAKWFGDIVAAAELAAQWSVEAGGPGAAMADTLVRSAIERQLLIISEAAKRLDHHDKGLAEQLAPSVDWAGVRGIGNVLKHRYDDLDFDTVSSALREHLAPLREACIGAIASLKA